MGIREGEHESKPSAVMNEEGGNSSDNLGTWDGAYALVAVGKMRRNLKASLLSYTARSARKRYKDGIRDTHVPMTDEYKSPDIGKTTPRKEYQTFCLKSD